MNLYPVLRPLLLGLDAETAHRLTLKALRAGLGPRCAAAHPVLQTTLWGRSFANPLGLAAGFDKDAEAIPALFRMGFGFVEAGTVTPLPQAGNPRPRVFRDLGTGSVVNRMGFPGKGLDYFAAHLEAARPLLERGPGQEPHTGKNIIGANIGINKDTASPFEDYKKGLQRLAPLADYVAVNVSSPNTAGLRDLQRRDDLDRLLEELGAARGPKVPLLLKVAPDLDEEQRRAIAELVLKHKIDGLIVSNTTVSRPPALAAALQEEKGGLSGKLLFSLSTAAVADFYRLTGGVLPIVGVGGIAGAEDVYAKIRAGASLVQVYTGLVFEGPALIPRILDGLARLLARDGFDSVAAAVGADHGGIKRLQKSA